MRELFVTLGHNSSAVLAVDGKVVRGYEQERLDRVKSSSAFPKEAIEAALGPKLHFVDRVYVSHWFDQLELESNKYLDLPYLNSISGHTVSLSPEFTHHDAHAQSALSFLHSRRQKKEAYVIVLDGFGTFQECLSVYDFTPGIGRTTIHRTYGLDRSLGMMYQYVTEYLGMKPHRDEYKLLGYESHVTEHVSHEMAMANYGMLWKQGVDHAHRMLDGRRKPADHGDLIDRNALALAKAMWHEQADMWRRLWPTPKDENAMRALVGFSAQTFLEAATTEIIDICCTDRDRDLILVGGCFMNVKLSRRIRQGWTAGNVFAHPLCGDQGAAMGFRAKLDSSGLCWGERKIGNLPDLPPGCVYVDDDSWVMHTVKELERGNPVNVVRGNAEFGARALCNTTTFATPDVEMVSLINKLNDRDEAMPMAPVMTMGAAMKFLEEDEILRSQVSNQYMVTTVEFREEPMKEMMGVAHKHPLEESWTARPQIVLEDDPVAQLLGYTINGCLINTSFNFHGEPIVQSEEDAIATHKKQSFRALQLGRDTPVTLLVRS